MPGPFYFAWLDAPAAFNAGAHNVEDEKIFSFEIAQQEGGYAGLTIEVHNPKVGLLGAGRNLWQWLSWFNGTAIVPLFTGRLIGVPEAVENEVVKLTFIARPDDYAEQKAALAETLKVPPFWDQIWVAEGDTDPDTVLEARTARWNCDRISLTFSIADILDGEDGTIEVGEADHLYDELAVSYAGTPLRQVTVKATVTWPQQGMGDIDLTRQMVQAFQDAGSPVIYPMISSLTDGIFASWPKPGDSLGGQGWTMSANSLIEPAQWVEKAGKAIVFLRENDATGVDPDTTTVPTLGTLAKFPNSASARMLAGYTRYSVQLFLKIYVISFIAHWEASRPRSETVTFTLSADIQPLVTDPEAPESDAIELSSEFVGQPVDPDGALPIGDLRRNAYFPTDRGQQSFQYLVALARAKLLASARAVEIKFQMPWTATSIGATCRKNVRLLDYRLPGGEATGKITTYTLSANGDAGDMHVEATIGCTIGRGGSVSGSAGTGVYAAPGYMQSGYQAMTGATIDPGTSDVTYQSFADIEVLDDGLNLMNLRAEDVITGLTVENAPSHQLASASDTRAPDDPITQLELVPTTVTLSLKAVTGRSFHVDYAPEISVLKVPKTIDLEAA